MQTVMNQNINYRPELDGLRAIAVLAVLSYHAKISILGNALTPGGFLGVDIFFVLSGYLISSIIVKSTNSGDFSFFDFYIKRIKRIIPALSLVLLVSSFVAYKILLPDSFLSFGKSMFATLFFISNVFFYHEDSYVSEASDMKPLLHTWSLSVEWQFYLLFPVVLLFIIRILKSKSLYIIIALWLISFAISVFQAKHDADAAFFLLPSRSWELLSGTVVALINRRENNSIAMVGLVLIILSIFLMNDNMEHPSWLTLFPVIGTCAIILCSGEKSIIRKILSMKSIVFIGMVSYSLYLWHQPIFVFFRIVYGEVTNVIGLFLIILAFIIATASYYLLEKPLRVSKYNWVKKSYIVFSLLSILLFCLYINKKNGDLSRLPLKVQDIYYNYDELEFRRLKGNLGANLRSGVVSDSCYLRDPYQACTSGDASWVTIGDSYAGTLDYYLNNKLNSQGRGLLSLTYEQCPFVNDIWFGNVPECTEVNKRRWDIINGFKDKKTIVLAANYSAFINGKKKTINPIEDGKNNINYGDKVNADLVWKSFSDNVNKLSDMGHDVIIIYPIPSVSGDVKKIYFSMLNGSKINADSTIYDKSREGWLIANELSDTLDRLIKKNNNIKIIRPVDAFCDEKGCLIINSDGGLYNGGSHLSHYGVKFLFSKYNM